MAFADGRVSGIFARAVSAFRGAVSLSLFVLFGAGAVCIAPLMILLRSPQRCQPVVRTMWRFVAWLFEAAGLIRVRSSGLDSVRGSVIVANHPSLIDVVLLTALVPRTMYVAKHALLRNPVLSMVVRHTALPDDEMLPEAASPFLAEGWNVLIFPEGTRSPSPDVVREFRRGAAQLSLRTGAPVVCVGIRMSRAILGKRQKPWDMGTERVVYSFRAGKPLRSAPDTSRGLRPQAAALTETIRSCIVQELLSSVAEERHLPCAS